MFEIPNTKELREEYKTQKNSSGHRESARARVSGIYDIENEFMVDAIITDCSQGEKTLVKTHVKEVGNFRYRRNRIFVKQYTSRYNPSRRNERSIF